MPLHEAVRYMLAECGGQSTGEGLLADAKLVATLVGVEFTTLRETVDVLARHFGLDAAPEPAPEEDDSWEARVIQANAEASAFPEDDDSLARHILSAKLQHTNADAELDEELPAGASDNVANPNR